MKQVKKKLFTKAQQKSWQNPFYRELMLKLDISSTQAISVKNYEIKIFRSDCMQILVYLYRLSFLTTLDIYKDYFKGCHTCIEWPNASFSLKETTAFLIGQKCIDPLWWINWLISQVYKLIKLTCKHVVAQTNHQLN